MIFPLFLLFSVSFAEELLLFHSERSERDGHCVEHDGFSCARVSIFLTEPVLKRVQDNSFSNQQNIFEKLGKIEGFKIFY